MNLHFPAPMSVSEAKLLNPLKLAYLGDSVWELLVGSALLAQGLNLRHMHREAVSRVNARAQAEALSRIAALLDAEEEDIVRRGRNSHPHHAGPRHQEASDYRAATAMEALMGFLYVTGQEARLQTLFIASQTEEQSCQK